MNVINSVKEYVTTVFDLGSTRTEAIDVVAIQHDAPDQQVRSTPFYVRFEVTKYHDRRVDVFVNGEQARGVYMELDSNGEAFFARVQSPDTMMEPMFFTDFGDPPSNPSTFNSFNEDSMRDPVVLRFSEDMRTPSFYFDAMHSAPPSVEKASVLQKTTSDYFDAQSEPGPHPSATSTDHGDPAQSIHMDLFHAQPALSLCGDLLSTAMTTEDAAAIFRNHQVSADAFRRDGIAILQDPALRVLVHGTYHRYDLFAQSQLVTEACFPTSKSHLRSLMKPSACQPTLAQPSPSLPFVEETAKPRRHTIDGLVPLPFTQLSNDQASLTRTDSTRATTSRWLRWFRSSPRSSSSRLALATDNLPSGGAEEEPSEPLLHRCVYPDQDQLGRMHLVYGPNKLEFRVKSNVFGEEDLVVTSTLFLWHASTKLVVADIDFAVSCDVAADSSSFLRSSSTKYDVADGAPDFFSHVLDHGYQLIYLSSRNPVDSREMLDFLPQAPLLGAFGTFDMDNDQVALKLSMLQELQALYPPDVNPYYAALTNANHTNAFLDSGLHPGKVLVVDSSTGRFRLAHQKVHKDTDVSYANLRDPRTFDFMFPPVNASTVDSSSTAPPGDVAPAGRNPSTFHEEAFNDLNFWRLPPPRM
ncbi:hypothetical protein, variant [Aphanomyces invadans]|uniref:LNS2/PITP domain-containing protein n=1 Tax=Aphanomyces invadans TaxID=157072 RepID=A0A024TB21_9STRA|nr:hypothetical protein, variant [Aphanomyces invadans]ETV91243.1 hypothetical protein, variant [Aphanomyces invadans]|eukprot:XP_008880080.1 hypothetical protein, variant [Aphanomyces invadans]